jgi:hypothetical protein
MDLSPSAKRRRGVDIVITVSLGTDGLWSARAYAADIKVEVTGMESPAHASASAARQVYQTAQALNREQWFWK